MKKASKVWFYPFAVSLILHGVLFITLSSVMLFSLVQPRSFVVGWFNLYEANNETIIYRSVEEIRISKKGEGVIEAEKIWDPRTQARPRYMISDSAMRAKNVLFQHERVWSRDLVKDNIQISFVPIKNKATQNIDNSKQIQMSAATKNTTKVLTNAPRPKTALKRIEAPIFVVEDNVNLKNKLISLKDVLSLDVSKCIDGPKGRVLWQVKADVLANNEMLRPPKDVLVVLDINATLLVKNAVQRALLGLRRHDRLMVLYAPSLSLNWLPMSLTSVESALVPTIGDGESSWEETFIVLGASATNPQRPLHIIWARKELPPSETRGLIKACVNNWPSHASLWVVNEYDLMPRTKLLALAGRGECIKASFITEAIAMVFDRINRQSIWGIECYVSGVDERFIVPSKLMPLAPKEGLLINVPSKTKTSPSISFIARTVNGPATLIKKNIVEGNLKPKGGIEWLKGMLYSSLLRACSGKDAPGLPTLEKACTRSGIKIPNLNLQK